MKKRTTKIITLIMALSLMFSVFSCSSNESGDPLKIGALKGPTAMGLSEIFSQIDDGEEDYQITTFSSPDEITPKIINGEIDIAFVPTNLAAVLYNKTQKDITMISTATLGVLHLVSTKGDLDGVKGQKVLTSGEGTMPQYIMDYVFNEAGIEPGEVVYKAEHSEVLAAILAGEADYAVLPEPFVTTALSKSDKINRVADLGELFAETSDLEVVMGVAIVRNDILEESKKQVDKFLKDYENSVEFTNENIADAAKIIGNQQIVTEEIAKNAISECNIVCITGEDMKKSVEEILEMLYNVNPKAIGGAMPDDDFFYEK